MSSGKRSPPWLLLLVVSWFAVILVGLWWLLDARLTWFDGSGRLQTRITDDAFVAQLKSQLRQHTEQLGGAVFHIDQEDCRCNWRTHGHQAQVKRQVSDNEGQNYQLDIDQVTALQDYIPATPAIIIFNQSEDLIYLGPYADGAFCNTETSFVEQLIPRVSAHQSEQRSGWINLAAKGCYCPVAF